MIHIEYYTNGRIKEQRKCNSERVAIIEKKRKRNVLYENKLRKRIRGFLDINKSELKGFKQARKTGSLIKERSEISNDLIIILTGSLKTKTRN